MRRFALALFALFPSLASAAEVPRTQLQSQNNAQIVAGKPGGILASDLNALLGNMIDSTGMLRSVNNWQGLNTFSAFTTLSGGLSVPGATWENPIGVGNLFLWQSAASRIRYSTTTPGSDSAGSELAGLANANTWAETQTFSLLPVFNGCTGYVKGANTSVAPCETPVFTVPSGLDPTGVLDSSASIAAAAGSNKFVALPCGTYKVNLNFSALTNFQFVGAPCVTLEPFSNSLPVLKSTGGNFNRYTDFRIIGNGSVTAPAVQITGGASNTKLARLFVAGFPTNGVECLGTALPSGDQSGIDLVDSYVLLPLTSTAAGVYWEHCQDGFIERNQIGILGTASDHSGGTGLHMVYSSAMHTTNNLIWSHTVGVRETNSQYNQHTGDRVTQNLQQGILITSGGYDLWTAAQVYQNSSAGAGLYPDVDFVGTGNSAFTGSTAFNWNAVDMVNYNVRVDSTSFSNTITDNHWGHYTVAPTSIASAVREFTTLCDNTPRQTLGSNNCPAGFVTMATPITGVGGTLSTLFLSIPGWASASEQAVSAPFSGLITQFSFASTATPAVGETWTYTLRSNSADTALTATQANGAFEAVVSAPTTGVAIPYGAYLSVKVVSSNGATNLGGVGFRGNVRVDK